MDLRSNRHHLQLARQDLGEAAQPLGDVDRLEQLLLLLGLQTQGSGDQVRERARVLDVRDHDLKLFREVGHLVDDVGERLLDVARQGRQLRRGLDDVRELRDLGDQIRVGRDPAVDPHPLPTLDQHPQGPVRYADHPRDDADHPDVV